MSSQLLLLDVEADPAARPEPPEPPDWLGAASATQRARALRGLHPTGRRLAPSGSTCGSCTNCVSKRGNTRNYTKCYLDRLRWTAGPGSDIRLRWPACDRFQEAEPGAATNCLCSERRVAPRCPAHGEASR